MIHTIIKDIAIVLAAIAATAMVIVVIGAVLLANDEADGNNPFQ